jgi:hypothetical protein
MSTVEYNFAFHIMREIRWNIVIEFIKTELNNFPKQLTFITAIGLKFERSVLHPLFLYMDFIFPVNQLSSMTPVTL